MIRKFFVPFILLFLALPALAQEVVVFKSHRSIRVVSHTVKDGWTHLKLKNGEIAVPSETILSISKEKTSAPASSRTGRSPSATPRVPGSTSTKDNLHKEENSGPAPGRKRPKKMTPPSHKPARHPRKNNHFRSEGKNGQGVKTTKPIPLKPAPPTRPRKGR